MDLLIFFLKTYSILFTLGSGIALFYVIKNRSKFTKSLSFTPLAYIEVAFYLTSIYAWFI